MLPERLRTGSLHAVRTVVDAKLMERTGLDEFSLRRLRKVFGQRLSKMSHAEREALADGCVHLRFQFMVNLLKELWPPEGWQDWLRYLGYSDQDAEAMCRGDMMICEYDMRVYSALFGIKVDYLLLGSPPAVDRDASIDAVPVQNAR
ncbi:MAG: hypothetical protein ACM3XM_12165 [Mycobacterium leprae]